MPYTKASDHIRLRVRLTPNGGRDDLDGLERNSAGEAYIKARVSAAPEKGRANKSLVELLAKRLGVPKSRITMISGDTSRQKILRVEGDTEEISRTLNELLQA
ncbi:DUF167 domain-containing protein [Ciceribacter sp. L1K23]|uniref:DUF167 domain-containing protein n=1 Tax=unclassified Ciceribacter TaxID=2628820 RepID=UPI001ABE0A15|nr:MULTISPECIES: DUF167 domain-containing protein [unclassified Ciceribacter]MBO3762496.1 DUF167 domain-containing protein [Ciceribacter sp. L1K22]MBR0554147.1 DUF167 domain-containing protein [Ciceribacter sp. L1K23]